MRVLFFVGTTNVERREAVGKVWFVEKGGKIVEGKKVTINI
jgi:hypothetical protein